MIKINRKLISLLILMIAMSIIVGCSDTQKAPEGVDQEFYDDMVECLKKLQKHKGDEEKNGIDVVEKYLDNKTFLSTTKEVKIIEAVDELYFYVWLYHSETGTERLMVKEKIQTVSDLMELDIDINKIIPKK